LNFGWKSPALVEPTRLQKESYAAGFVCGTDPATPYGIKAPEGLDSVAFAAGLIEGRGQARKGPKGLRK